MSGQEISQEQMKRLQERFKHYLRSYRQRQNLSTDDMAKKLGYSHDHYKRFEQVGIENRLSSVLEFLASFAKLEAMSLPDFLIYLENPPQLPGEKHERDLFPWEKTLLQSFTRMDLNLRQTFVNKICHPAVQGDRSQLDTIIGLAMSLSHLTPEQSAALEIFLAAFDRREDREKDPSKLKKLLREILRETESTG